MIRYKVKWWDSSDEKYVITKGWCAGSSFEDGARVIEKYYGDDCDEATFKIFDNYEDEIIEDNYLEVNGAEDLQ